MLVLNDAIAKPKNLEAMKNMAKILAYNFACVDLYEVNSRIFVGELTMTPVGDMDIFTPSEWDIKFGNLWEL